MCFPYQVSLKIKYSKTNIMVKKLKYGDFLGKYSILSGIPFCEYNIEYLMINILNA